MESTHPGLSSRLGMGTRIMLSVVGDVPLDREAPVVTSSENPNPNLVKAVIGVGEDARVE